MTQALIGQADLTTCDREPIHIPGMIQPFGVMAVFDLNEYRMRQVSENSATLLGRQPHELLGMPLISLIGARAFQQLQGELVEDELHSITPSTLDSTPCGRPLQVFYHRQAERLVAEFEVKQEQELSERGFWHEGELPFTAIYDSDNLDQLSRILVREVRRWTGFDRVLLYRFDEDWHGQVIAEDKSEQYGESFLGHHFPATDIPAQARALFTLNRLRFIPDVTYQPVRLVPPTDPHTDRPLDMSQALLRNVSPVHLEYLQNMGVRASLTISLLSGERLWGMVTCHHRAPRLVPHSIRLRCKILGELASYTIAAMERRASLLQADTRRHQLEGIGACLERNERIADALRESEVRVLTALNCDGVLVRLDGEEIQLGQALAPDVAARVGQVLQPHARNGLAYSRRLTGLDSQLADLAAVCSGALWLSLNRRGDSLLAFRREILESRVWAGNPYKPLQADPHLRIHPRKSFERWRETVHGYCQRWKSLDLEAALDIKRQLLARREQIKRQQAEQALRESEARFRATFEQAAMGVAHVDLDGRWLRANQKLCEILGYPMAELLKLRFQDVTYPDDLSDDLRLVQELLRGDIATYRIEKRYIRKSGVPVWANLTVSLIRDDRDQPKYFIAIVEDISQRKHAEERTTYLANHDALTGLPNRAHFSDRLHEAMARCRRDQGQFALLLLDLDRFKSVNDTLGHHVGDLLLQEVSARLLASVRETDLVARLGGDEFVVIQQQVAGEDSAETLARKIVRELGRPYRLDGQEIRSGTSVGITLFPGDADDQVELLKNADLALYRAKDRGRHNFQFFSLDMQVEVQSRRSLETALRHALERRELRLHYQPVYDLSARRFVSAEALLRWQSPQMRMLNAAAFLDLAEESGLILPIGEWVLEQACQQAVQWQQAGLKSFRVGVNLSLRHLKRSDCVSLVRRVLEESRLPADCLELEVTEGQIVLEQESAQSTLAALKEMGVRLCADDFGAGLSSLSQLRRLPVDALKIDQSIVQRVPHSRHDAAVASAVIGLAQDLNIQIVAEGVETLEQLAFLKARGCTSAQGFLFSPPVEAGAVSAMIHRPMPAHID